MVGSDVKRSDRTEEVARSFLTAVAAGEWETVRSLAHDTFVTSETSLSVAQFVGSFGTGEWEDVVPLLLEHFSAAEGEETDLEGMIDVRSSHFEIFEPVDFELTGFSIGDGRVAFRSRTTERHVGIYYGLEPSNEPVSFDEIGVLDVEDGSVTEFRVGFDQYQYHRNLGVSPTDGVEFKVQEQFYGVLNRVLRHNLRNDLNAIVGYAGVLAEGQGDPETLGGTVRDIADDLLATAEKARVLEQRVVDDPDTSTVVDLAGFVGATVADYRGDTADADVVLDVLDWPGTIATKPALLEMVLEEAIGNAIAHGGPGTEVRVGIEASPEQSFDAIITVADDGPGIPDHEVTPLSAEREDPLEHGSGIGLWLLKWGMEKLEGDISFETPPDGGTVIQFRLVDLEEG